VLEGLARLHASVPAEAVPLDWNYEAELAESAESTLELLEYAVKRRPCEWARYGVRHVRILARELHAMRDELLQKDRAFIHGDVHPGNVRLRVGGGREQVVLLDWSRARIGSPLEDVSSWLQSLGFWEPRARQRHDTLLRRYLIASGRSLTRALRTSYWLAGASNALAGALRYHVWLATDSPKATPLQRARAATEARYWLRIVRRGAEYWGVWRG
jgi:Ser/Thr protein kinase RdoA (MazF antagonist)